MAGTNTSGISVDPYSSDGVVEHNRRVQVLEGMSKNKCVWMLGLLFPVAHRVQVLLIRCTHAQRSMY